jgi:hypothetical protein
MPIIMAKVVMLMMDSSTSTLPLWRLRRRLPPVSSFGSAVVRHTSFQHSK